MDSRQSIVSLWKGETKTGEYLGCGICISPNQVLTAKHVVCPSGNCIPSDNLTVGSSGTRENGVAVGDIHYSPSRDVAILTLKCEHEKNILPIGFTKVSIGQSVMLLSYNKSEMTVKGPNSVEIANWAEPDSWEFDKKPAHGMSGGAVVLDNVLIGVIQARDEGEESGIMIPLSAIRDFLEQHVKVSAPPPPVATPDWQEADKIFMDKISTSMESILESNQTLFEKLRPIYPNTSQECEVINALVEACQKGDFADVVRNLDVALESGWVQLRSDHTARSHLLEASYALLDRLTLFNVRQEWLVSHHEKYMEEVNSKEYIFPNIDIECVHIALSATCRPLPPPEARLQP